MHHNKINAQFAGAVELFIDDVPVASAAPGTHFLVTPITFAAGNVLRLQDGGANSVMRLNGVSIGCKPNDPCAAISSNDFSSVAAMEQAGWVINHTTTLFNSADAGTAQLNAACYNGGNWWSFSGSGGVDSISIVLPFSGSGVINFGNCWNEGTVELYINNVLTASAPINTNSVVAPITFAAGDTLSLHDAGANSVLRLNSVIMNCHGSSYHHLADSLIDHLTFAVLQVTSARAAERTVVPLGCGGSRVRMNAMRLQQLFFYQVPG